METTLQKYTIEGKEVGKMLVGKLEHLDAEEQAQATVHGLINLQRTVDEMFAYLKNHAVSKQTEVVSEKDLVVQESYQSLEKARKNKDFDMYDRASSELIKKIKTAKSSVSGLKNLIEGNLEAYINNQKLLEAGE